MWGDIGNIVLEGTHGEAAWHKSTVDEGGGGGGGGGASYLYGFLPPGDEDGEMPSSRLSGSIA